MAKLSNIKIILIKKNFHSILCTYILCAYHDLHIPYPTIFVHSICHWTNLRLNEQNVIERVSLICISLKDNPFSRIANCKIGKQKLRKYGQRTWNLSTANNCHRCLMEGWGENSRSRILTRITVSIINKVFEYSQH